MSSEQSKKMPLYTFANFSSLEVSVDLFVFFKQSGMITTLRHNLAAILERPSYVRSDFVKEWRHARLVV